MPVSASLLSPPFLSSTDGVTTGPQTYSGLSAGDVLVVSVHGGGGSAGYGISDSAGLDWTQAETATWNTGARSTTTVFVSSVVPAGVSSTDITVTRSSTGSLGFFVHRLTGASGAIGQTYSSAAKGSSPQTTDVPADDGSLALVALTAQSTVTYTQPSGFTMHGDGVHPGGNQMRRCNSASRAVATATSVSTLGGYSGNADHSMVAVELLPTTGAPPVPNQATGAGTFGWTGVATGAREAAGAGQGTWAWSGAASGSADHLGTAAGAYGWSGQAEGQASMAGEAAGTFGWTGAAVGSTDMAGSGSGSFGWTGVASGSSSEVLPAEGFGAGSWAFSGQAMGSTDMAGSGSGSFGWSGVATGAQAASGSGQGTWAWSGAASGSTDHLGTAAGAFSWSGQAAGSMEAVGTGFGQWSWTGVATGDNRARRDVELILGDLEQRTSLIGPATNRLLSVGPSPRRDSPLGPGPRRRR